MLITLILLIAMLGAIVLATGSVEEDKMPPVRVSKSVGNPAVLAKSSGGFVKDWPPGVNTYNNMV
jgi:hypothetical protein